MSNFPDLSYDAISILIYTEAFNFCGRGPRLGNTKARRELKRHKLIEARAPNWNSLSAAIAGQARVWYLTDFGTELALMFRKERKEAGIDLPTYSDPGAWMLAQAVRL